MTELETLRKQVADMSAEGGSYRSLQVKLDAALQKHKEDAAAHEKALVDALAVQASKHAAEIAKLKADVLAPALRDLHARQQADIDAKRKAELAALTGG